VRVLQNISSIGHGGDKCLSSRRMVHARTHGPVGVALPGIKMGWESAGGGTGCRNAQNIEGRWRSSCTRYVVTH